MWNTNMYSNIILYQKYLVTSIKVSCAKRSLYASSGPKAEGVPTGTRIRSLSPLRRFGQGPSYSPHHLVSQSATLFRNDMYKSVKGSSTRNIVLSMMAGSY